MKSVAPNVKYSHKLDTIITKLINCNLFGFYLIKNNYKFAI